MADNSNILMWQLLLMEHGFKKQATLPVFRLTENQ
jgi:hypothetical protein